MSADFSRLVVEAIARRAANSCSNPDCVALTIGPAADATRAVNVGQAAHIYGARAGSARFRSEMSDGERADITNAIWLCGNCHKQVDSDPIRFPAELLFEWKWEHEKSVSRNLGKAGALLRSRVQERLLSEFPGVSHLAQQIIIDKPDYWEYRLTAELLRSMMEPLEFRWGALRSGLYALPNKTISVDEYIRWYGAAISTIAGQVSSLAYLLNGEMQKAWGVPDQPGSDVGIFRTCSLIRDAAARIIQWEEDIKFLRVPNEFQRVHALLLGIGGRNLNEIFSLPGWLAEIVSVDNPSGEHRFVTTFSLPEGWIEEIEEAMEDARHSLMG